MGKNGIHEFLRKPLLTEKNTMISHLPENILMALKSSKYEERAMATFGFEVLKVIYAPTFWKVCVPLHQVLNQTYTIHQYSNVMVVVWWSAAHLLLQDPDNLP